MHRALVLLCVHLLTQLATAETALAYQVPIEKLQLGVDLALVREQKTDTLLHPPGRGIALSSTELVTCRHVVETMYGCTLDFGDGVSRDVVSVIADDDIHDLIILRFSPPLEHCRPPTFAVSKAGDRAYVVHGRASQRTDVTAECSVIGVLVRAGIPQEIRLSQEASDGWSGSPVLSDHGNLLGLLQRAGQAGSVACAAVLIERLDRKDPVAFRDWLASVRASGRLGARAETEAGTLCVRRNDRRRAAEHFRSALAADPTYLQAMQGLMASLWELGERREAKDIVSEYLCRVPDDAEYWRFLGGTQIDLGDLLSATTSYERAVSLDLQVEAMERLASCYLRLNRPADAERLCRQAIAIGPPSAYLQGYLGVARFHLGDRAGAVEALEEAVRLDAACAQWWQWWLAAAVLEPRPDRADRIAEQIVTVMASPANVVCEAAAAVAATGALEDAAELYRRAIAIDRNSVKAYVGRVFVLEALGRLEEAESVANDLLQIAPENRDGELVLARISLLTGRYREAASYYRRLSERADPDPNALYALGIAQAKSGDPDGSLLTLKRLQEIAPNKARLLQEQLRR